MMLLLMFLLYQKHNGTWPNLTVLILCCCFFKQDIKMRKTLLTYILEVISRDQVMKLLWVESCDSVKWLTGSSGWLLESSQNTVETK